MSVITLGTQPVQPTAPDGSLQSAARLYVVTGAPNNAQGTNGDFVFRSDGGALTRIYQKVAGSWLGIL